MYMNWVDKIIKKEKNQSRIMRIAITLTLTVAILIFLSVSVFFFIVILEAMYAEAYLGQDARYFDPYFDPSPVYPGQDARYFDPYFDPSPAPVQPTQRAAPAPIGLRNPLAARNLQEFLEMAIDFLFWIGLALAPVFILMAAFYFMTAAGNPAQIETGKRIITYTVIGLIVIIMARGAVEFIQRMF